MRNHQRPTVSLSKRVPALVRFCTTPAMHETGCDAVKRRSGGLAEFREIGVGHRDDIQLMNLS